MALLAIRTIVKEKDKDSGKKWFAVFVGVIMLMSVAGFVFSFNPSAQGSNFRYGDLTFRQTQQGFFATEVNGRQVDFFYRPEDVSDIDVPGSAVERLTGSRVVYITYYWNSTLAEGMALLQFDAANLLDSVHKVFAQAASTTANPFNLPLVTCGNSTSFIPVLLFQEANNTAISVDSENPDCIVLSASSESGFARAADRLKYALISGEAGGGRE
ncbi:hypothetical protein HYU16_03555 [Candidatus Woesearchaeota archaeon]|nr:hypothetical protein [Candidatus Woesearchaeota archaeon]